MTLNFLQGRGLIRQRRGTDLLAGLELALAIRNLGSLTRAARSLGETQSSASRQLAALEATVGAPLFKRTTRSIVPTEAGHALLQSAPDIVRAVELLLEEARTAARAPGLLRVSTTPYFGRRHVLPHLLDFQRQYPDIDVRLSLSEGLSDLAWHDVDLAIQIGHPPDTRLIVSRIATQRRVLCAAPSYLAARGWPTTPEDLTQHSCLLHSRLSPNGIWHIWRGRHYQRISVTGPLASNGSDSLVDAAVRGVGIVMLASWAVNDEIAAGSLVELHPEWRVDMDLTPREISFFWMPQLSRAPRLRRFVDFLKPKFGRPPYWDAVKRPIAG